MQDSFNSFYYSHLYCGDQIFMVKEKVESLLFPFKKEIKILVNLYNPPNSFKAWLSYFQLSKLYPPTISMFKTYYVHLRLFKLFFCEWQSKEEVRNLSWWMLFLNFVNWICLYRAIKSAFSRSPVTSSYQVQWFTDSSCVLTSLLHLTLLLSGYSLDLCLRCHACDPSSSPTRLMAPQIPLRLSVSLCPLSPGMQPIEKDF